MMTASYKQYHILFNALCTDCVQNDESVLHWACRNKKCEVAVLLAGAGADPNSVNKVIKHEHDDYIKMNE